MKRFTTIFFVSLVLVSAIGQRHVGAAAELPEEVLCFGEIANIVDLDVKLRDTAMKIVPMGQYEPMAPNLRVEEMWTDDPNSVDLSKPIHFVLLERSLDEPAVVFTATDATRYLDSVSLNKTGEESGLGLYETDWGRQYVIGAAGNRIVLGQGAAVTKGVLDLLQSGALSEDRVFPGHDIGGALRVRALIDRLELEGEDPFGEIREAAGEATAEGMGGPAHVLVIMADALEAMADQVLLVSGGVAFGPDAITASGTTVTAEDGTVAAYLKSVPAGEMSLLKYMPADAIVVSAGKMGDLTPLARWVSEAVGVLAQGEGATGNLSQVQDMAVRWAAALGDECATAIGSTEEGTLQVVEAIRVGDASGLPELLTAMPAALEPLRKMQRELGVESQIDYTPSVEVYNGHEIGLWNLETEFVRPEGSAADDRFRSEQLAMQEAILGAVWGEGLTAHSALLDDVLLYVQGGGSLEALKQIIDGSTARAADSASLKQAMTGMPGDPQMLCYVSLGDMIGMGLGMASAMMQATGEGSMAFGNIQFPAAPPLSSAARVVDGSAVEVHVRVPHASLQSVVQGFTLGIMMNQAAQPPSEGAPVW
jgi:hypothetical protein